MAKRILIFSTAYYPHVGGAEVSIKEITDRIQDFEFDLITAKLSPDLLARERVGNVNVLRIGVGIPIFDKLFLPFRGFFAVRKLQRQYNYHAFYCVMATFASGAAYLFNMFSRNKVPIILNLQEGDSEEHFEKRWFGLINLSWKMALKRTDLLTVLSRFLKDRALNFGYTGEVEVVPNGVDANRFNIELSSTERLEIRQKFGLESGDIVLVTTSRLVKKNGVGDVIESLAHLEKKVKFLILGEGDLKEELQNLATKVGVSDRVIFAGNVSQEILPKYLKAADIFIRSSLSEGFGISFIEAMAARIPVIATAVGGITDFLVDGETGYFCKPGDPANIATTIMRVMSMDDKNRVVENAYKMVLEKYDWERIVPRIKKIFENIKK